MMMMTMMTKLTKTMQLHKQGRGGSPLVKIDWTVGNRGINLITFSFFNADHNLFYNDDDEEEIITFSFF